MAGKARKIVDMSKRNISNKEKENRRSQEKKLKLGREDLRAPSWLNKDATAEFERIVEEAGTIDLLDNLDLGMLAIYCNAYTGYIDTVKNIAKNGMLLYKFDKIGAEIEYPNPVINTQEKYVKQIMQCSTKLGLATTDRLKLIVPTKEESKENKFISLMRQKKA